MIEKDCQFYSYEELRTSVSELLPKELYDKCLVNVVTADRNYYQTYSIKCNKDGCLLSLHGAKGICRTVDCLRIMYTGEELHLLPDLAIATIVNDYFSGLYIDSAKVYRFSKYVIRDEASRRLSAKGYRWHNNSSSYFPPIDYLTSVIREPSFSYDVVRDRGVFAKLIASSFEAVFEEYSFTYVKPDFSKWFP